MSNYIDGLFPSVTSFSFYRNDPDWTNTQMKKVSIIFGTRPEAIKLAPVILKLRSHSEIDCNVCVTAQHREMMDQVLDVFEIKPDVDLDIMRPNQSLAQITSKGVEQIDAYLDTIKPDHILVQGDTTTTFVSALTAFYHDIPVGHVEAGLRTGNLKAPWPEEANRILTSRLSTIHFAPTENNKKNLITEGVDSGNIFVTGNTVIDALFLTIEKVKDQPPTIPDLEIYKSLDKNPIVLITGHRRENFGKGLESICNAIVELAKRFPDTHFVYPVHLNPKVKSTVKKILGENDFDNEKLHNIHLIDPLPYLPFVSLMDRATLILTDSGGIQEEAPSLGKPVLVTRDTTERLEAVKAGTAILVGTNFRKIVNETSRLLTNKLAYQQMSRASNPYGDGKATQRILDIILGI